MNDAKAFYILCKVNDYLLGRRPFDQIAFFICANLKANVIRNSDSESIKLIDAISECRDWKEAA